MSDKKQVSDKKKDDTGSRKLSHHFRPDKSGTAGDKYSAVPHS